MYDPRETLAALSSLDPALDLERLDIAGGDDPVHPTPFRLGAAASAAIGGAALAAAAVWQRRGGEPQQVEVDLRRAAAALTSFLWLRLDGAPYPAPQGEVPTMAIHRCADGRWIHLHGALPHLRDGTLALLGCEDRAASIAAAVARWNSFELEDALAAAGQCGAVLRSADEWAAHPQGIALAGAPLVELRRIGDAPRRALGPAARPLAGLRVLDLTRILAGPTCARTLAEHGADVLRLVAPHQQDISSFVPDTSHGKRVAWLDLDAPAGEATLRGLLAQCDVFSQGYRGGALAARGFGPEALAALRPGIVCVSINAYGHEGPWAARRGWEQLAQACTGVALEHCGLGVAADARPAVIPAAPSDYCSGYLAALGAMFALLRQAGDGGSWEVRVSLARTAQWLRGLGRVADAAVARPLQPAEIAGWSTSRDTGWGRLGYLAPVAQMALTPASWERPSAPPGSHAAQWE
ncbi:MAG: CoA transferase [Steroidobacteraceae bacterium]|jgi:crotonobetainyl-CoA:carnitine CoA-transferase CaiB-like acyl-CoA transferase|nr:CoA transferase [Steroidobacteraceae bacterium]